MKKRIATVMAVILISVCGWAAIVTFVIAPNIWVGSALSLVGGVAIGGVVSYLMIRWWFKSLRRKAK